MRHRVESSPDVSPEGAGVEAQMSGRVFGRLRLPTLDLGDGPEPIPSTPLVERDGGMNQGLDEPAFGWWAFPPDVFPHLMSLEVSTGVEQCDPFDESGVGG
jgi:hypothetical protein